MSKAVFDQSSQKNISLKQSRPMRLNQFVTDEFSLTQGDNIEVQITEQHQLPFQLFPQTWF